MRILRNVLPVLLGIAILLVFAGLFDIAAHLLFENPAAMNISSFLTPLAALFAGFVVGWLSPSGAPIKGAFIMLPFIMALLVGVTGSLIGSLKVVSVRDYMLCYYASLGACLCLLAASIAAATGGAIVGARLRKGRHSALVQDDSEPIG
jgi:hypothetical protein